VKTIIAGSRSITDMRYIEEAVACSQFEITEIVSGGAKGIDTLAITYAQQHRIPLTIMRANWDQYGKSAGFRRNGKMANYADALIAIWDGQSRGTLHMINVAKERKLKVYTYFLGDVE
jgi:hypothetical protein